MHMGKNQDNKDFYYTAIKKTTMLP